MINQILLEDIKERIQYWRQKHEEDQKSAKTKTSRTKTNTELRGLSALLSNNSTHTSNHYTYLKIYYVNLSASHTLLY